MVHTGQNHTPELKDFFFRDLKLRAPDFELELIHLVMAQKLQM